MAKKGGKAVKYSMKKSHVKAATPKKMQAKMPAHRKGGRGGY